MDNNCLIHNIIKPKIKNLQFELGKKFDRHFGAKFYDNRMVIVLLPENDMI